MSPQERIAKLEELLARVQSRSGGARENGVSAAAVHHAPAPVFVAAAVAVAVDEPEMDVDAEVEVSADVVEVDIDVDEPLEAEVSGREEMPLMESGAQPVANPTMPPDELEEVVEEEQATTRPSRHPEGEVAQAGPANELEEEAPSSSPRPIEGEAESYEDESSPRHTPPPESGKQVAAAPSAHPPSRKPSAPPPSLEGHTLIGGWREPGVPREIAGMGPPGVRVPAPPPSAPPPAPPAAGSSPAVAAPAPAAAAPPPQPSGTRVSPDVTRANLPMSAKVATFEGAVPAAKPATFGDLVDWTLGL